MKNGKNPTLRQKKRIASYKLNPNNWLVVKDCKDVFSLVNRNSGKVKNIYVL